jgi:hypothetical protein
MRQRKGQLRSTVSPALALVAMSGVQLQAGLQVVCSGWICTGRSGKAPASWLRSAALSSAAEPVPRHGGPGSRSCGRLAGLATMLVALFLLIALAIHSCCRRTLAKGNHSRTGGGRST